jgi:hypothetical protein
MYTAPSVQEVSMIERLHPCPHGNRFSCAQCRKDWEDIENTSLKDELVRESKSVGALAALCALGLFLDYDSVSTWMLWGFGFGVFMMVLDAHGRISGAGGPFSGHRAPWRRHDPVTSWFFDLIGMLLVGTGGGGAIRTVFAVIGRVQDVIK